MHPDNAGGMSFEFEDNAPTVPSPSNPDVDNSRHYLRIDEVMCNGMGLARARIRLTKALDTTGGP
jgi:hypothetical protein